jgi:hypothetical protein
MKQREAYYEVFRHQVDVDRLRSGEVVNRILTLLELKLP